MTTTVTENNQPLTFCRSLGFLLWPYQGPRGEMPPGGVQFRNLNRGKYQSAKANTSELKKLPHENLTSRKQEKRKSETCQTKVRNMPNETRETYVPETGVRNIETV